MEGFTLILLTILIWLLYRLYKKEPKRDYSDKPREDYIISETREKRKKII